MNHSFSIPGFFDDSELKLLINNLFNQKYESYGGHYFYDIDNKTYSGVYFYPMAEINFLVGLDLNF
jgi:iron complex outermembrane receptor protein